MRIRRLGIENFRQFYGKQELKFDGSGNVHIIYAANGAGKTTILNAFSWALYRELSDDFENPDQLVNKTAVRDTADGETVAAVVEVEFDHDGLIHIVRRVYEVRKLNGQLNPTQNGEVSLITIDDTGASNRRENPTAVIDQILPRRLHAFFFLNGERIEHLVKPTAYEDIESAIKTLLGLELVERSQHHLGEALKLLQKELRKVGTIEVQELVDDIERYSAAVENAETERTETSTALEAQENERKALSDALRAMEDTRKLQERRDQLEQRAESTEVRLKKLNGALQELLAELGFLAFVLPLRDSVNATIEENRVQGELPAPIKEQFVLDLLNEGVCICGTHLEKDSEKYRKVDSWRLHSGIAGVEETLSRLGGFTSQFDYSHEKLHRELSRISSDTASAKQDLGVFSEKLDEVSELLKDHPLEDAARLEQLRISVDDQIGELRYHLRTLRRQADDASGSKAAREKELATAHQTNMDAIVAKRRVEVATEARDALDTIYSGLTQAVRVELDAKIKSVYSKILYKAFVPSITEDFQLELRDPGYGDERVAQSVGENQILTLAFVGALAALARPKAVDIEGDSGILSMLSSFSGGSYPIILDAAFGTLDDAYQTAVASALPQLADQIIVLVSKSQGLRNVRKELLSYTSGQTVINFFTTNAEAQTQTIDLDGRTYPYVTVTSDGRERAELITVED